MPLQKPPQPDITDGDALQALNLVSHSGEHLPNLPVLPLMNGDFNHRRARILFDYADLSRRSDESADVDASAELRQTSIGKNAGNRGDVGFAHLMLRMRQSVGQFTVVGHDQKPRRVVIQPADRKQPLRNVRHKIRDGRAVPVVAHGRDVSQGLVHSDVDLGGVSLNLRAVDGNHVPLFDLRAHLPNDGAVYLHISIRNQLVCLSPGTDSC